MGDPSKVILMTTPPSSPARALAERFARESPLWLPTAESWEPFITCNDKACTDYVLEDCVPANPAQDPALAAAGVQVCARTVVEPGRAPHNEIVFRAGDREGRVTCVHTAIAELDACEVSTPDERAKAELALALIERARSTEELKTVQLPPQEHFLALRSTVHGWTELGWLNALQARYEGLDPALLPFGMNDAMHKQVVAALARVAPSATCDIVQQLLEETRAFPEQERQKRWEVYKDRYSLDSLVEGCPALVETILDLFKPGTEFLQGVAESSNTPPAALATLARDVDLGVRATVAGNSHAPPDVLAALARDEEPSVRYEVAKNLRAPPDVLAALARDKQWIVRLVVAWNERTPPAALATLACAADKRVRAEVAANPNTPPDVLATLARDENREVRESVFRNPHISPEDLAEVAEDPHTPPAALADLAGHEYWKIRGAVAENPQVPEDVLLDLAHDDVPIVRRTVAGNPRTPPDVLLDLAHDTYFDVQSSVAQNPAAPPDALAILAGSPDPYVRSSVAGNENTPPDALATLARDEEWEIRERVARHSHTPPDALAALAHDPDPEIREIATNRLRRRGP